MTDRSAAEFDEDGLLKDSMAWTPELAQLVADRENLGKLSEAHWRVISALRDYHARFGVAPAMSQICREAGLAKDAGHTLFHTCLNAWRIAGLPNPGEEAKSYLSDM